MTCLVPGLHAQVVSLDLLGHRRCDSASADLSVTRLCVGESEDSAFLVPFIVHVRL